MEISKHVVQENQNQHQTHESESDNESKSSYYVAMEMSEHVTQENQNQHQTHESESDNESETSYLDMSEHFAQENQNQHQTHESESDNESETSYYVAMEMSEHVAQENQNQHQTHESESDNESETSYYVAMEMSEHVTRENQNQHQTHESESDNESETSYYVAMEMSEHVAQENQNQHQTHESESDNESESSYYVPVEISEHITQESQNQHQTHESESDNESESSYCRNNRDGGCSGLGSASSENSDTYQVAQTGQTKSVYHKLYQAVKKCKWHEAKVILQENSESIRRSITESRESVLHTAFASKHMDFIKDVLRNLTDEDLERTNIDGDTALCFAAKLGIVTIAKALVEKNIRLPLIRSDEGRTPLYIAVLFGHRDMASYLCTVTTFKDLILTERTEILVATITYDMYDIALDLLKNNEKLLSYGSKTAALLELARKPFETGSKSQPPLWKRSLNFWSKSIHDKNVMPALVEELVLRDSKMAKLFRAKNFKHIVVRNLLFDAAEFGNGEFIHILIGNFPHIVCTTDDFHRSLFHSAVINRQESVFNLIYDIVVVKEIILTYVDAYRQNILHLAGKLAPPSRLNLVPGAALQMQREMLWFKEVEKIVPPSYLKMKNSNNQTPWELFTKEHENLRVEGEKWMKDTVNFYIVVATLITGVAFAAAFTVPGGSNQETGSPILLRSIWFRVFFLSDAIALLSSSTSILLFLSILSSPFKEIDFLVSLPSKLELGVSALFNSIAGTLVAFIATCFLVFKSEMKWLPIVIIALAGVPPSDTGL
nr:ankyrin repeat-containing protein itn1 [Quercus suber]